MACFAAPAVQIVEFQQPVRRFGQVIGQSDNLFTFRFVVYLKLCSYGANIKVCGVDIKGSEAILAVAHLAKGQLSHISTDTKKIALADDDESANVKSFFELAASCFQFHANLQGADSCVYPA